MICGRYLVSGFVHFRGHPPGTTFTGRIPPVAEYRAIERGDLQLLERVITTIEASELTFPAGWFGESTRQGKGK